MASNTLQEHPDQNAGERLLFGIEFDDIGNVIYIYDQEVDVLNHPDLTPVFGTVDTKQYNEKNRRRSRVRSEEVDVYDLFSKLKKDRHAAQELGGGQVTTTITLEDASSALADPTANDLTLIGSTTEHRNRAHGIRVDTRVDQWNEFVKEEFAYHPDATGGDLQETHHIVAAGTAVPTGATILEARNVYVDDEKVNQIVRKSPGGFGTMTVESLLDEEAMGAPGTDNIKIVDLPYAMPAATYQTVKSVLQDLGTGKGRYIRKDVTWPTYVDEEEESTTGKEVLVTREVIDSSLLPLYTKGTARTVHQVKHINEKAALHTQRVIDASILTDTWTEYHNVEYYFPSYLEPTGPFALINAGNNFVIAPNQSSDLTVKIPCRFEITYHTTPQIPANIFQFKPVDLNLISPEFRLTLRDIICNSGTLYFRFQDGLGSYVQVQWTIPASDPTASYYINTLMGSEVLIADDSTRWKYNLYRRVQVYMTIPDLSVGMNTQIGYY